MTWPIVSLNRVAVFINGDRGKNYPSKGDFIENGIPFINAGNIASDHSVDISGLSYISEEHFHTLNGGKIEKGDVIFCLRGSLGKFAIIDNDMNGAIASSLVIIRPNKLIELNYLKHYLSSFLCQREIKTYENGAAQPNLSAKDLKSFKIPLPPFEEQKRIASILDKTDTIRQKRQQAISLADDFLRSIFLEMFIRAADNWTVKTIEYIADKGKGGLRTGPFGSHLLHSEFVDSGIPVLGIDNAVENSFKWGKARFITEEKYKSLSRYTVHPGDVLITIMGTCGRCAVVPDDIPTAINTKHLCCISLDYKKALPEFLHSYYLFHPMSRQYLSKVTKGAIMDGLNMGLIKTMPFPMVPIKLQKKYVEIKMAVLSNLDKQHLSESYQESLFNSLNQQLFAGKCLTA